MKKKPKAITTNQPSLFHEEERLDELRLTTDSFFFSWSDITFEKDCIKLNPTTHKNIFPVIPFKGSLGSLNQIKDEYFSRLHPKPVKLFFIKNVFQEQLSRDWQNIKELIEPAFEYYQFKFNRNPEKSHFLKFDKLKPEQVIKILDDNFKKNVYLKYLATRQANHFKIIPILEYQNNAIEDSFIFRITTLTGRILIVWENSKKSRATHLFIANEANMESRLALIESYVINSIKNKRSLLHDWDKEAKKIKGELFYIDSISHKELSYYKTEIQTILNRY